MVRVTCTVPPAAAGATTCSGKAMTKPDPAVAVPAGTNTATKPGTCTEGELIVLTLTPELEVTVALLLAEAVALVVALVFPAAVFEGAGVPREDAGAALTAGSAVVALLTVETVKSGGAVL